MLNISTPSPKTAPQRFTLDDARRLLGSPSSGTPLRPQDHGYSKVVAERYGIPAALVLKYLAFRISKSSLNRDGRQWFCQSIADIAHHYSYLSASAIHAALRAIPESQLLRDKIRSRRTRAMTTIYAFGDEALHAQINSDLIYFSPLQAATFGLHEAVIIHHLEHWIRMKRKKVPMYRFHPVSPTELAERLKISRASISRAIKALVEAGVLERNPEPSGKCPEYAFTPAHEPVCW